VLLKMKAWPREARLALAFAIPCLIAFVLFWPVQGIAIEMDMIVALFPAVFALLWVCSQSLRASIVSAVLLAIGHASFWWVVSDDGFINGMLRCSDAGCAATSARPIAAQNRFLTFRPTASATPAAGLTDSTGASAPADASSTPTRNGTNLKTTVMTRL